jgi:ABC-type branched-subunit amino acid transport system substrate-binding protein
VSEAIHRLLLEASHSGEACALATVAKVTRSASSATRFACLVALALAAFAASPAKSPDDTPAPIKIGAVLPFSGGVELYGRQAKLELDLAVKEINTGGGIFGRPVKIIYEDDKTGPDAAMNATRKLIELDHVLAVVGPITSRNLNAIKPEIERAKTPLLYATNYEGGACSRYIFAFGTVPNQELAQLLPYMTKRSATPIICSERIAPGRRRCSKPLSRSSPHSEAALSARNSPETKRILVR